MKYYNDIQYTVESVLCGHPDKICDQISDFLLDQYLSEDKHSHTTIECMATKNKLIIAGEIKSSAKLPIEHYCSEQYKKITGLSNIDVINLLSQQSNQLSFAISNGGAGDQGIMYGYAVDNEYNCLPYGYWIANMVAKRLDTYRNESGLFLSDGKIQVSVSENGSIDKLSINVQHRRDSNLTDLRKKIIKNILFDIDVRKIEVNPIGLFINGGIENDTGLTGRKIIMDTYGGMCPHGGGAFSGKDPSKVDRSAAYMCRYVAKNIVKNHMAEECIVSVAYEFGKEKPCLLNVITDGKTDRKINDLVNKHFDFRPEAIIERLNLRDIKYLPTSTYGHFTDSSYEWEKIISLT